MSGYHSFALGYDALTENVNYRQRAEYICSLLCRYHKPGGILLDACCGTGSLSEIFAEKGYDVIGVDNSAEMLMQAQEKKYQNRSDTLYLLQDVRDMDLYGTVDCAVCCLDSVNHLSSAGDVGRAFYSIGFFMEKDGIFIFDVNTLYKHRQILADNAFVYDTDAVYCVWQNRYQAQEKRTDIRLDLFFPEEDGSYRRESEAFSEWVYSDRELTLLLEKAGFAVLDRFAELTLQPPADDTQRVFYVCRKTKDQ